MIEQVVDTAVMIVKCFAMTITASVKALLPMGLFPGEVVLITGSGSGLGRGMAMEFGKLGAKIVLWDINENGNLETKKMLEDINAESKYARNHGFPFQKKIALLYIYSVDQNQNRVALVESPDKEIIRKHMGCIFILLF
ncbi:hypothetical protein DICVIV_00442 [Dictyocaulus viviparus]|uniref:Oxidoreductase, short chain dehydrogenase/reductase family protein n=1 Tax=Dictyocaulus viviparus TaxID=29172 RepID=A0A0D8YBD0_DICVI|nr:hypothetical protein DICVIV_00442 [Dictyocaulus viviparus]